MPKLEIHKMLVLSTSHLSEETAQSLPSGPKDMVQDVFGGVPSWWPVFARNEGWVFYAYNEEDNEEAFGEMPEDLVKVLQFARARDCKWVMFDRDGDQVKGLPTYEW